MSKPLISPALVSLRAALAARPLALAAIALAAGMSSQAAHAWGSQYESVGRTVGAELGRAVGGSSWTPAGRIASVVGEVVGGAVARPLDEAARAEEQERLDAARAVQRARSEAAAEQRALSEAERQGREKARRDAAYEAERKRLDPNYQPAQTISYGAMADQAQGASRSYSAMSDNIAAIVRQQQEIADRYQRNRQRGR